MRIIETIENCDLMKLLKENVRLKQELKKKEKLLYDVLYKLDRIKSITNDKEIKEIIDEI